MNQKSTRICPLGLKGNCIFENSYLDTPVRCINLSFCKIVTAPWRLPYEFTEINGIKALVVLETKVEIGYGGTSRWHRQARETVFNYGFLPGCRIFTDDEIPW